MNKKFLDEHLADYYGSKSLPKRKLARLKAAIERGKPYGKVSWIPLPVFRWWRSWIFKTRWATVVIVGMLMLTAYMVWESGISSKKAQNPFHLSLAIAREIAYNHNKNLDVEFIAKNFSELGSQMKKLDFAVVVPTKLSKEGLQLIGARYCSLQGHQAVQIRLMDSSGKKHTLYQARLIGSFENLQEGNFEVDGLQLRLWKEKGLLMGLASPPPEVSIPGKQVNGI